MYNPLYFRLKMIITTAKFYEDLYYFRNTDESIKMFYEALYIRCVAQRLLLEEFNEW